MTLKRDIFMGTNCWPSWGRGEGVGRWPWMVRPSVNGEKSWRQMRFESADQELIFWLSRI